MRERHDQDDDNDGDGVTTCAGDCWDGNANVHPNAEELCNGPNDDCDEWTDEGFDKDGDGYRDCSCEEETLQTCDCNDFDVLVHPDAEERCDDDIDNNCDGSQEDIDADFDQWTACGGDCNDHNPFIHPLQHDICDSTFTDHDCDGLVNEGNDPDGDGVGCNYDCDWTDPDVYGGNVEQCDEKDNDCNLQIDEIPIDQDGDGENICADCDDNDADNQSDACDTDLGETAEEPQSPERIPPSWFCNSVGGNLTPWGLGLALLLYRRRSGVHTTDKPT